MDFFSSLLETESAASSKVTCLADASLRSLYGWQRGYYTVRWCAAVGLVPWSLVG